MAWDIPSRGSMIVLIKSRVRLFMDPMGLQTRSLETLMVEAYLCGFKDAVQAATQRGARE